MNDKTNFVPPKNKNDMTGVLKSVIKKKNVGVFIDSANLYYATNKASIKIDYFQIARWFKANSNLTKLNFYTAFDPLDERQAEFFKDLEKSGYSLIKKPIRVFADSVKGNMDIELAVDVLMSADKFDSLVLISGDGDFQRLIQALDQLGKKTIILGVGGFTSYELHQEADNYFFLNRIQEVWKKPRTKALGSKQVALPSKFEKDGVPEEQLKPLAKVVSKTNKKPSTTNSNESKEVVKKATENAKTKPKAKATGRSSEKSLPRVKVKMKANQKSKNAPTTNSAKTVTKPKSSRSTRTRKKTSEEEPRIIL